LAGATFEAFYLPRREGSRFCILHTPPDATPRKGAILYVHPFAEEMNRTRRGVAVTARALVEDGWTILLIDLLGCGDSSGDFGEATWAAWLDDVADAYAWLQERAGSAPVLWGLRVGCLLIAQSLPRLPAQPHLVLWQPVVSGKIFLNQFLRLKAVAAMLDEKSAGTNVKALREQLARGETVEIAGYSISPNLALPLEAAELELPAGYTGRVLWGEVGMDASNEALSPAAQTRVGRWRESGTNVEARVVGGLPFWQTLEIAECPGLADASRAFLARVAA
jgi:exosortase A-associated hydrolase 2